MRKKLTITRDGAVYEWLHQVIGRRHISQFIESVIRPHVVTPDLLQGYQQMAADDAREAEALEWAEATVGDLNAQREERREMTEQQKRHFEAFGYLVLPSLLADDVGWISEEFEAVFQDRGMVHDGTKRSCIVPFIDQRERLATLLDHPRLQDLIAGLLGDDFNYLGGDGNYYAGDTGWHSDGSITSTPTSCGKPDRPPGCATCDR